MALVIHQSERVDAPASTVWSVVTDLAAYGAWNAFVVACSSTLAVGDPIDMRVKIFGEFAQSQRETVFEHEPGVRLCYGLAPGPTGAIASRRSHEVRAVSDGACEYVSHFELRGWASPLVALSMGGRLRGGFESMTAALCRRAVTLAAQPRP